MTRIGSIRDCVFVDWDVKASFDVSLAILKFYGAHRRYKAVCSEPPVFEKDVDLHSLPSATPKKMNLGPISDVRLPLPLDPAEQRLIASTLHDALLGGLDRLIAKKRNLKQVAIATVLSAMDVEIAALEQRRDKTKDIKQAMMRELLTGETRLEAPSAKEVAAC